MTERVRSLPEGFPLIKCSKAVRRIPDGFAVLIGKDRSGDGNCYFAGRGFFSRARTRMTCNWVTRWLGRSDAFSPYQAGISVSCLVYHDLPALDDFWHESPRKCAETPRQRKKLPGTPAKNRKPSGLRLPDGFLLYRKIWEWRIFSLLFSTCIIPPMAEKAEPFCTKTLKMTRIVPKSRKTRLQRACTGAKKGLLHCAVQQSLRGYKGLLTVSGLSRASGISSRCG